MYTSSFELSCSVSRALKESFYPFWSGSGSNNALFRYQPFSGIVVGSVLCSIKTGIVLYCIVSC